MHRIVIQNLLASVLLLCVISCQDESIHPEMVYVPGGSFIMGSDSLGDTDERPAHNVTIKSFCISKYEITQREWILVMRYNPSVFKGYNKPVENISWYEAQEFISRLNKLTGDNYRLPTESEWEYVAVVGCAEDDLQNEGWGAHNSGRKTHAVGELKPNSFGVYDIVGNVHEWCIDSYDSLVYAKKIGLLSAEISSTTDEVVARGGNWASQPRYLRLTNRNHAPADYRSPTVGFRVAMDVE